MAQACKSESFIYPFVCRATQGRDIVPLKLRTKQVSRRTKSRTPLSMFTRQHQFMRVYVLQVHVPSLILPSQSFVARLFPPTLFWSSFQCRSPFLEINLRLFQAVSRASNVVRSDRSVLLILITQTDQSFSRANHCSLQAKTGIALFTVCKEI